jgi:hypothetical protein
MGFSEYENIEIFNKTQSFAINKFENQILRQFGRKWRIERIIYKSSYQPVILRIKQDKVYI